MMTELNFKNKTFITSAAVFILMCLFGYNIIYRSNIEKADKLKLKIEEAKKIKVLMEDIKVLQDKISAYLIMRNDSPEPSSFLSSIVEIANNCDIKAEDIKAGNAVSSGPYKFLPCGISFVTPFQKLQVFLNKLETDKKYIRIEKISIAPVKSEKTAVKPAMVNVNMELNGFYTD